MDINNNNLILFVIISLIINFCVVNYSWQISKKLGLVDIPDNKRKRHSKITPLIGSLSIVILLLFLLFFNFFSNFVIDHDFIIIFISSIFVFFVGAVDDRINLSPLKKIVFITIISFIALYISDGLVLKKFYVSTYDTFFYTNYFSFFFTILCLLTLSNAFNLIDGIDGLSIGIIIIWFVSFLLLFNYQLKFFENDNSYIFFLILILNLVIIFVFNLKKRYFLGDSGTLFLSYFFGLLLIKSTNENYLAGVNEYISAEQILIIFLIPFLDMLRVMISRIIKNKNPFLGDRNHFHHYLLNFLKKKNLVIFIYFIYVIVPIVISILIKDIKLEIIIVFSVIIYLISLKYLSSR